MKARHYMFAGIAVIACMGCGARRLESPARHESLARDAQGGNAPADNEPPHNEVASMQQRLQLVARAEQAVAARRPLDYQRPFVTKPIDDPSALYLAACQAGDKPSCWIAASMAGWGSLSKAGPFVLVNCQGGDIMSCRALESYETPEGDDPYGNAPGWAGRSEACIHGPCDVPMLRHECEAGFALSCYRLMHQGTPPDDAMKARVLSLARAGCRELIENECNVLNFGEISSDASSPRDLVVSPADRQLHADRMCLLYLDWCEYVSTDYRERGELVRARDVEEQVCQYGGDRSQRYCLRLSEYYIDGLLPEPVVGRGEALIAWACGGGELPREPKCKEWAAKHPVRSRTSR